MTLEPRDDSTLLPTSGPTCAFPTRISDSEIRPNVLVPSSQFLFVQGPSDRRCHPKIAHTHTGENSLPMVPLAQNTSQLDLFLSQKDMNLFVFKSLTRMALPNLQELVVTGSGRCSPLPFFLAEMASMCDWAIPPNE